MKSMRILLIIIPFTLRCIATPLLRSTHRSIFAEVSKHKITSDDWDYADEGSSWTSGECASIDNQSPINISTTVAAVPDSDNMYFNYPIYETPVIMKNDGRNLYAYIKNDDGDVGGIFLGLSYPVELSATYYIYKILIHTPSEHTFGGKKVPCEVQLYHRQKDAPTNNNEPAANDTAVVAVGFDESEDESSSFLSTLVHGGVPEQRGAENVVNRGFPHTLQFTELLKAKFGTHGEPAGFWEYNGSLSQPPCTSDVRWFVRSDTLSAQKQTLDSLAQAMSKASGGVPSSARKLQDVGVRPVFPRLPQDATNMQTFDAPPSSAFAAALSSAQATQSVLKQGLAEDLGTDGSGSNGTVVDPYKLCLADLGDSVENLDTGKRLKEEACANMEAAKNTVESLAGSNAAGPAIIEASTNYAVHRKACEDEIDRVAALDQERTREAAECETIKNSGGTTTVQPKPRAAVLANSSSASASIIHTVQNVLSGNESIEW